MLAGLVLLAAGGDALVRAATTLARIAGVSPAIIGLTVIAMGTSLPELVVSLFAALGGQPDTAVGSVVGSNIFNIGAALGITAVLSPLPARGHAVRFGWPVMFAASVGCYLLARDGTVSRWWSSPPPSRRSWWARGCSSTAPSRSRGSRA